MAALKFKCPSCSTALAPIESMDHATHVVRRTCRKCGERWQLIVRALRVLDGARIDKAEFTFLGRKEVRR